MYNMLSDWEYAGDNVYQIKNKSASQRQQPKWTLKMAVYNGASKTDKPHQQKQKTSI